MNNNIPLIQKGWLRALVFLITWLLLQVGTNLLTYFVLKYLAPNKGQQPFDNLSLLIMSVVNIISNLLIVWLFRTKIDRKSFVSLGFQWQHAQNHAYTGFFAAILIMGLGSLVLLIMGNLHFIGVEFNAISLVTYLIMMVLVAVGEELVVRGYILNNLLDSFPKWVGLLISSALFAAFHLFNPGVTWLSTLGVFTGGLVLGVNYIYTRNLWYGILFHFAWNFLQGPILGYPVSGIEIESLMVQTVNGAKWWTGGAFGFEASLLSVLLTLLLSIVLYVFYQRKNMQPVQA